MCFTFSKEGVYALGVAWDLAVSGLIPWVWGPPPLSPAPGGAQNNKKGTLHVIKYTLLYETDTPAGKGRGLG